MDTLIRGVNTPIDPSDGTVLFVDPAKSADTPNKWYRPSSYQYSAATLNVGEGTGDAVNMPAGLLTAPCDWWIINIITKGTDGLLVFEPDRGSPFMWYGGTQNFPVRFVIPGSLRLIVRNIDGGDYYVRIIAVKGYTVDEVQIMF